MMTNKTSKTKTPKTKTPEPLSGAERAAVGGAAAGTFRATGGTPTAAAAVYPTTPIASQIEDMETSMSAHKFISGRENLWVPEHGWTDKDEQAGEDPHSPQYLAALDTFLRFFVSNKLWVHLAASMQAGKTGVVNALVRLMMIKENFSKIGIAPQDIFLVTGMSDNAWKQQTRKRMPHALRENIQHSGGLARVRGQLIHRAKGGTLKNVLIVIDESHFASAKMNRTSKFIYDTLRELCPIADWAANNIRLLTISATDPSLVLAAGTMRETASVVGLLTTDKYQSIRSMLDAGRVHKTFDLDSEKAVQKLMTFIHTHYGVTPLYHIIRPRAAKMSVVQAALTKLMPTARIINWDATSNASRAESAAASVSSMESMDDINDLLATEPDVPTFILLKNMFYASKTLDDVNVGVLHDRPAAKDDTNLQSLLGRACGYGKSDRTHVFATLSTVENWLELWETLSPRSGNVVPDKEAKALDNKMAGLKARSAAAGGSALYIAPSRATPLLPVMGGAAAAAASPFAPIPPTSRNSNQASEVQTEVFDTMADLIARWNTIVPGDIKPRTPNMKDGIYQSSLGGKSKRCTKEEVLAFCVGTRGWGSGITNADVGDFVKRVYAGYEGDVPKFILRWAKKQ